MPVRFGLIAHAIQPLGVSGRAMNAIDRDDFSGVYVQWSLELRLCRLVQFVYT